MREPERSTSSSSSSSAIAQQYDQAPSRSSIPAPLSVASPLPSSSSASGAHGQAGQATPGGAAPSPFVDPDARSRSGSLLANESATSSITPTHAANMRSQPGSTLTSPNPMRSLARIPQVASPSAVAPPSAVALQSLQNLITSRVRAFARILRGVSPPIGYQRKEKSAVVVASSRSRRSRDPLHFHASQLKRLVQLSSEFYARPVDTLNLCWHWLHATTLAVHHQQTQAPARPRLDAASLQFLKYLTQMARQVEQVRVPLFFNRIVAQWMEERQGQPADAGVALPTSWPSLHSIASSSSLGAFSFAVAFVSP